MANNFPASGLVTVDSLLVCGVSEFRDTTNFSYGKISWGGSPSRLVVTSCGTYNLGLATDNFTDRMTIQASTGNVGIGTTSPTAVLQVRGPNATGTFFDAQNDGAAGATFVRANQTFPFNEYTFANGNVGIGTTPTSLSNVRLQICDGNANGTDDMVRLMQCLPGNHAFYRAQRCGGATMIMGPTRNSGDGCIPSESAIIWTTTNNPIVIGTCGRQRMRFATDGNAVLGGASANIVGFNGTVLTVNGGGNYQGYEVATSNVSRMTMVSDGNNGYLSTRVAGMCLIFEAGAASEKMRIGSDGNVGIGTSSPSNKLDVAGSIGLSGYNWIVRSSGDGNWGFGLCNNSTTYYTYLSYAPDATADRRGGIYNIAGNGWVAYGDCKSNFIVTNCVGIGTTTPSYKLHVNGTFYAAGSSIKYKEGICNYDTDSCLFMCLKPVTYQYKDEFKHLGKELKADTQIGLIAEDVAEVMPELAVLVNEEDEKVVRNVDYEKLSIVLLAEVQKLRKEMDELKQSC